MNNSVQIIFTDLDGTLLNSEKEISAANLECLHTLGRNSVIRVIATGRSLFSFEKLFPGKLPIDYLIFSTGAGVLELESRKLLHSSSLMNDDIQTIASHLISCDVHFMVHRTVPENHFFTYYDAGGENEDFIRRIQLYEPYAAPFERPENLPRQSAQVIAIFPNDIDKFERVRSGLSKYQITRTTSPLDGHSMWMEIFPINVSKGNSADWLCSYLNLSRQETLGIGNDYNDISLLDYTRHSYVVANAPADLQQDYQTTLSNNEDGFYHAAKKAMVVR